MSSATAPADRWITVGPERVERWLTGFHDRHVVIGTQTFGDLVRFTGADGAVAECHPPFPPLVAAGAGAEPGFVPGPLVAHATADRRIGALLVRAGGFAAGVFDGRDLIDHKVGSRPVHGRAAAGGWSQRRFARRRDGQLKVAYRAAADAAARVLLPHLPNLDAVVTGGDRRAVDAVRADARLEPVFALATERPLAVPDPRLAVLREFPRQFRAVRIRLIDPPADR